MFKSEEFLNTGYAPKFTSDQNQVRSKLHLTVLNCARNGLWLDSSVPEIASDQTQVRSK